MKWKARHGVFSREPDDETVEAIQKTLKQARVTIMEAKLMEAILLSGKDREAAKALVNKEIAVKNLEMAKISPLHDVQKVLWSATSQVLKNKNVPLPE